MGAPGQGGAGGGRVLVQAQGQEQPAGGSGDGPIKLVAALAELYEPNPDQRCKDSREVRDARWVGSAPPSMVPGDGCWGRRQARGLLC
jgi:hypothetical protein